MFNRLRGQVNWRGAQLRTRMAGPHCLNKTRQRKKKGAAKITAPRKGYVVNDEI